jgi:predicted metal-binding membrane protein
MPRTALLNRFADLAGRNARVVSLLAVALLAAVGWIWLIAAVTGGGMPEAAGLGMGALTRAFDRLAALLPWLGAGDHGLLMPAMVSAWGAADIALVFLMWVAMVLAMMLPTAAPTFRAYAAKGGTAAFGAVAGYTAVWLGAALAGTAAQTLLTRLGALAPHMAPAGAALSASILIAAGIYQFTPLKWACLVRCRNPRVGDVEPRASAAFRIGLEEGFACLGCCWAMMAVMFAAGMMNLVAMALLGALMGLEKVMSGMKLTYFIGLLLIIIGVVLASGLVIR